MEAHVAGAPRGAAREVAPSLGTMRPLGEALTIIRNRLIESGSWPPQPNGDVVEEPDSPCEKCQGRGFVRAVVEFGTPEFGKAIPCGDCSVSRAKGANAKVLARFPHWNEYTLRSLARFVKSSFPEAWQQYVTVFGWMKDWLDDGSSPWLYLFAEGVGGSAGGSGRGKTSMAFGLMRELMDRGRLADFIIVSDFLDSLRNSYHNANAFQDSGERELQRIFNIDVLVLDDIGAERVTESGWVQDVLFRLIAHRHMHFKQTIFTGNYGLDKLATHYEHPRIPSRIQERAGRGNWVMDLSNLPDIRSTPASMLTPNS